MLVEYKRDLSHNYMLIHAQKDIPLDSYELRVLMSNRIPGILPLEFEEVNGSTVCRYDITSCQPFHVLCGSSRMSAAALRELFSNLLDSLLTFEDYLLDPSHLMLDTNYLFLKWEECTLMVPFVPDYSQDIRRSLISFTESIIMQINHGQEECVVLACQILHELQKKEIHLADLRAFLETYPEQEQGERAESPEDQEPVEPNSPGSMFVGSEFQDDELYSFEDMVGMEDIVPADKSQRKKMRNTKKNPAALSGAIRTQIPEKETLHMVFIAAIPSALLYVLLQIQSFYLLSFTETAGAALLAAALMLLLQRIAQKRRLSRRFSSAPIQQANASARTASEETALSKPPLRRAEQSPKEFHADEMLPLYALNEDSGFQKDEGFPQEEQTTILSNHSKAAASGCPALIPMDPSAGLSPIQVQGRELLIGKQKNLVDAVIDKDTISRIHARIFRKNNLYYLSDMGSKNGTSIDGRAVVGREEVPLTDGAQVTFSDITYVYKV